MIIDRQQLHALVDVVDAKEFNIVYHVLAKFIPSDIPTLDEITAIAAGRDAIQRGEVFRDDEIDWNAPPVVQA